MNSAPAEADGLAMGPVFESVLETALVAGGFPAGAAYGPGDSHGRLCLQAQQNLPTGLAPPAINPRPGAAPREAGPADTSPVRVVDLSEEPGSRSGAETAGLRARVELALSAGGLPLGAIHLYDDKPRPVTPDQSQLLEAIGRQAAAHVLGALRYIHERTHRQRLSQLYSLSAEIAAVTSLDCALDLTVRHVLSATDASSAVINLLGEDGRLITRLGLDRHGRKLDDEPLPRPTGLSVATRAASRPLVVTGLSGDTDRLDELLMALGIRAFVGLPLRIGPRSFGALFVRFDRPRQFSLDEIQALELYADQAAGAIERLHLLNESQRHERELAHMLDVVRAVSSTLELDEVLRQVAVSMASALDMDECSISAYEAEIPAVRTLATYSAEGERRPDDSGRVYALADYPMTAQVVERGEAVVVRAADPEADPREVALLRDLGDAAVILVPLHVRGRILGLAELYTRDEDRSFTPAELELSQALADQLAVAIDNAALHAEAQKHAQRQAALFGLSRDLAGLLEEDAICERAVAGLARMLDLASLELHLVDGPNGDRVVVAHCGPKTPETKVRIPKGAGLSARALDEGRMRYTPDVRNAPEYLPGLPDARSEVDVPIWVGGKAEGVLVVESPRVDGFSVQDRETLQGAADLIELGLERARLYRAEQRARLATTTLQEATAVLNSSLRLETLLEVILQQLRQVVPYASATVMLVEGSRVSVAAAHGHPDVDAVLALDLRLSEDTLLVEVVESRAPLILQDARADPRYEGHANPGYVRGWMAIPLLVRNEVLACLTLDSLEPGGYDKAHAELASAFAGQAALAIHNARLYEAERRRASQLALLYEFGRQVSGTLDEVELCSRAARVMVERFGYAEAAVLLVVNERELEVVARVETEVMGVSPGDRLPFGRGVIGQAAESRAPYLANDIGRDPHYFSPVGRTVGSAVGLPVIREGELLGVMYVESNQPNAFSEEDVLALETLANQVATGLENARLFAGAKRRLSEVTALQTVTQTIASTLELDQIFEQVVRLLQKEFGYRYVGLYQLQGEVLMLGAQVGYPNDFIFWEVPVARGVMGRAIRTGKTQFIADVAADPEFLRAASEVRSEICIPLLKGGRALGALNVESGPNQPLTQADVNLLTAIMGPVSVAIDNARLYRSEREQRQLAEALREAGTDLSATLQLDEVLNRLLEHVKRVVPYDAGNVMLLDDGQTLVARQAGYERFGQAVARERKTLSFEVASTPNLHAMAETRKPLVIPDTESFPGWIHTVSSTFFRSWVGAPILAGDRLIGFFSLQRTDPNFYRPEHAERLSAFAGQAALAIENALLYQETTRQATTDWLTRAYNRHAFEKQLPDELVRSRRLGYPLSLLMVDLDRFKLLNDTHGHPQGDQALRAVADALRAGLRSHDTLYKYGGEEFAIILPGCGANSLHDAAERLRQAVEDLEFELGGQRYPISISLGGATLEGDSESPEDLIARADAALYEAKRDGRNCVRLA